MPHRTEGFAQRNVLLQGMPSRSGEASEFESRAVDVVAKAVAVAVGYPDAALGTLKQLSELRETSCCGFIGMVAPNA